MRLLRSLVPISLLLSVAGCAPDRGGGGSGTGLTIADSGDSVESSGEAESGDSSGSGSGITSNGPSSDSDSDPTPGDSSSSAGTGGDPLDPPAGQSSGGSGGGAANGEVRTAGNVTYRVIAPGGGGPLSCMIIYSGTEGGQQMTANISQLKNAVGLGSTVFGILDGVDYYGNGQAGAQVLDQLRLDYDIDNDVTYLLSESAGTSAGLELGLNLRQSYFAAYWANDVNASATPTLDAGDLGFAPFGNAGPGGDWPDANAIVNGMMAAGYRTPPPAPYDGPGSDSHGHPDQFVAALSWYAGKTRQ